MTEDRKEWHLDQKVTLALIFAILINAASSLWWAAQLDANVTSQESKITKNASDIAALFLQGAEIRERLVSIQRTQEFQNGLLQEVREELRRGREESRRARE